MAMAPKRRRAALICQNCNEPEGFDDMVNCGKCLGWTHFCCAGVGPKIENEDWHCARCKAAEMVAVQDDMKNIKMGQTEINKNFGTFEKKVSEMKDDINEVKQKMQELKTMKTREPVSSALSFQMSSLPSKTVENMDYLLAHVKSKTGFEEFKLHISAFCGSTVPKSVRNILFNLMDKDVQKIFSWSGLRTKKPSFEKDYKRIVDAISETLNEKFMDYNYDMLKNKAITLFNNASY